MMEGAMQDYNKQTDSGAKEMLGDAIKLHGLSLVRQNLGWYTTNGVIGRVAASKVHQEHQEQVKVVLRAANDWMDAFALP
jgi:hypothetical protein